MRIKKLLLIILISVAALGIGAYIFFKTHFKLSDVEKKLSKRIEKTIEQATNGLYKLSIGKTAIDVDNLSIRLQNLHFYIDSAAFKKLNASQIPANTFDIELKNLEIKNVDAVKLVSEKGIALHKILLQDAIVKMYHLDSSTKKNNSPDTLNISTLYDQIKKDINSIIIDTLSTQNVSFSYYGTNKKYKQTNVNRMNIDFFDIAIDSTTRGKTDRFLYAKDTHVNIDSFSTPMGKDMYKLSVEKIYMQIKGSTITHIKNLHLQPLYSQEGFSKKVNHQVDRFNIKMPEIIIDNFDYSEFLNNRSIIANQLLLNNINIDVYNDRNAPPNTKSKVGSYPHQQLDKLDFNVNVPLIKVKNATVVYREKSNATKKTGIINFTNANGDIKNVSNVQGNSNIDITVNARFMNVVPVYVHFTFPGNPKNGEFEVSGKFSAFDGKILNQATVPLGEVNIKQADIKLLSFDIAANDLRSNGKIAFYYNGIDIEMLKKDTSSKSGFRKRKLMTFLANNFLLKKKSTPTDNRANIVTVQYERDVTKSMFNLIWKTIFYGIKEYVGAGGMGKDKERAKF